MDLFKLLKEDDPYYPRWVDFRRRRTVARLAPLLFLIGTIALFAVIGPNRPVFYAGLFLVATVTGWLGAFRSRWRCPRCGKPFYARGFPMDKWPWPERCVQCGLAEYAPNEDY